MPVSQAVAEGNRLPMRNLPFRVIPNFISDELLNAQDSPHPLVSQLPEGEFMLYVGGLDRAKGVDVLCGPTPDWSMPRRW